MKAKKMKRKELVAVLKNATEKLDEVTALLDWVVKVVPYSDHCEVEVVRNSVDKFSDLLEDTEISTLVVFEVAKVLVSNVKVNGVPIGEDYDYESEGLRVVIDFDVMREFGGRANEILDNLQKHRSKILSMFCEEDTTIRVLLRVWLDNDIQVVARFDTYEE